MTADGAPVPGKWRLAGDGVAENGPILTFRMGHVFENGAAIATYSVEGAVLAFTADVTDAAGNEWTSVYSFALPERLVVPKQGASSGAETGLVERLDGFVTIVAEASFGEVLDIGVGRALIRVG